MKTFYLNKRHFCNPEYVLEVATKMGWRASEQLIEDETFFAVEVPTNETHLMEFIFDYYL